MSPLGRPGSFDLAVKVYETGALSSRLGKMLELEMLKVWVLQSHTYCFFFKPFKTFGKDEFS